MAETDNRYLFRLNQERFKLFLEHFNLRQKEICTSRKKSRKFDTTEAVSLVEAFNARSRPGMPLVTPCDLFETATIVGNIHLKRLQALSFAKTQERFESPGLTVPMAVVHAASTTSDHEDAIEFGIRKALERWALEKRWTQPEVKWFSIEQSKADSLLRELRDKEFLCVIGPFMTEQAKWLVSASGFKQAGLPLIVPGATADELIRGGDLVFRPCSGDGRKLNQLAEWITAEFDAATRPIILYSDCAERWDGYSSSMLKQCREILTRRKLRPIDVTFKRDDDLAGVSDLRREICRHRGTRCLVICLGFAKGYKRGASWALAHGHDVFGIDPRVASIEAPMFTSIQADGDKPLDGYRAIGDRLFANRAPGNLENLRWLQLEYHADQRMGGLRRLSEAAIGFDAVFIALQRAAEYSGFLRHEPNLVARREIFRRALLSTRPLEETIYGNGVFNEHKEIETPISRYIVRDGKCTTEPEAVV